MEIKDQDGFIEQLAANGRPVVVDFWAAWCLPCRSIEPALKRLAEEYAGRVDLWKVNADDHPMVLRELRIYGIPTLLVFRGGKEVARQTGASSPERLKNLFETATGNEAPSRPGLAFRERLLRLGAALILLAVATFERNLVFLGLGGLVFFSAVYDRCPVWQAIAPRLKALLLR